MVVLGKAPAAVAIFPFWAVVCEQGSRWRSALLRSVNSPSSARHHSNYDRIAPPAGGFQLIVAATLISVAINPILFRAIGPLERWVNARPSVGAMWRLTEVTSWIDYLLEQQ